ncbi:hypothetical protein E1264_38705 [Actinomadura sp. KC216]|uniref:hypothetical protein n=1 Tax=Actinomadura sp. KC216 TaxID=2530370 RepID=UPI001044C74B|nr:hypothetical protein [Actinomadura sp. KC216]TDB76305.1 hypothetical protein E1264_38705 [Actinomadura sp. KC216]
MSDLLARLFDDAALGPPDRVPMDRALAAHRAAARDPATGRFLCPASRFAELRALLVPEDLLDLGLIADTGIGELPEALDAAGAEPRVRTSAVRIALPGEADQARAAAVTIAQLPAGVPAHIQVRHSPGWRDALDRMSAAREHGVLLGAAHRMDGPSADVAAFIAACADRGLPFTCAAGADHAVRHRDRHGFLNILLATASATRGNDDVRQTLERTDASGPSGLAAELLALTGAEARATRRLLLSFSVPGLDAALSALSLIRTPTA